MTSLSLASQPDQCSWRAESRKEQVSWRTAIITTLGVPGRQCSTALTKSCPDKRAAVCCAVSVCAVLWCQWLCRCVNLGAGLYSLPLCCSSSPHCPTMKGGSGDMQVWSRTQGLLIMRVGRIGEGEREEDGWGLQRRQQENGGKDLVLERRQRRRRREVLYIRRGRAIFAEVKKSMSLWFAPVPCPTDLPQCHVPLVCPSASGLPQCPVPLVCLSALSHFVKVVVGNIYLCNLIRHKTFNSVIPRDNLQERV